MSYYKDVVMLEKATLLKEFRDYAEGKFTSLPERMDYKDKAKKINSYVLEYKDIRVLQLESSMEKAEYLYDVMMLSYVAFIVMLEYRNKAWPYEYMAFSRRIGEIWEPFCKLPFYYPAKELSIVEPPRFEDVQHGLVENYKQYVSSLTLDETQKQTLLDYYEEVWGLVDSGNISLSLDLHFSQNDVFFNVDYKSGFGSNEKGNTNRLLQVGSIYTSMSGDARTYRNMIFVRQPEDDNNHYLQTLKNSPYWSVYCAEDAYEQIHIFTGFDIKQWMADNMMWTADISAEFRAHLEANDLLSYLSW